MSMPQPGDPSNVAARVAEIVAILETVKRGDLMARIDSALPADHALRPLHDALNATLTALADSARESARYQDEIELKLANIERHRDVATPIIEVWQGVLCVPFVGVMDSARAAETTDALLSAVSERRATCAIVDVTGIEVMDTKTADHFLRMARTVRLLGAECVLTGLNPNIAQTVVHMGVDMGEVTCLRNVRDALQMYLRKVLRDGEEEASADRE